MAAGHHRIRRSLSGVTVRPGPGRPRPHYGDSVAPGHRRAAPVAVSDGPARATRRGSLGEGPIKGLWQWH
eukprot:63606-Hanusia_phi.AAC.1